MSFVLRFSSLFARAVLAALLLMSFHAYAQDEDDEISATPEEVLETADEVTTEYQNNDVRYHRTRPLGENEADCNSFVNDVETRAGNEVSEVSTRAMPTSPEYVRVDPDDAETGYVILTPSPDGERSGHMGIYSGDDDRGRSWGYQMGTHGAADVPFDGETEFYRPATTEDLEERVADQLNELTDAQSVGEDEDVPPEAVPGGWSSAPSYQTPTPAPSYTPPRPTYTPPPRSTCAAGRPCAGAAL